MYHWGGEWKLSFKCSLRSISSCQSLRLEHFGVHHKAHNICAYKQLISSYSLHLSSFYPYTSTYSTTNTTNVKNVSIPILVLKCRCIQHAQNENPQPTYVFPHLQHNTSLLAYYPIQHLLFTLITTFIPSPAKWQYHASHLILVLQPYPPHTTPSWITFLTPSLPPMPYITFINNSAISNDPLHALHSHIQNQTSHQQVPYIHHFQTKFPIFLNLIANTSCYKTSLSH
jgi:hypothetical protein